MAEDTGGTGSSFEKTLTKGSIGGVPVWGVGVGLAAIFLLFMWYRGRTKSAATPSPTGTEPPTTSGIDPQTGLPYGDSDNQAIGLPSGPIGDWLGQNPGAGSYPVGATPQGLPGPITNVQWSRLAADELLAKGDDPTLVSNALTKYLNGQTLSAAERAIVNLAIQIFGSPPEGLLPVSTGGSGGTPSVPTGLRFTGMSKSAFTIAWNPEPNATSYEVQWKRASTYAGTVAAKYNNPAPVSGTSYSTGIDPNHQYYYMVTVRAKNANGVSAWALPTYKQAPK